MQNVIEQDNFSSWKNGMCSFVVGNSTGQFSSITENQNRELILMDPGPAVESELFSQYVTHSDNMSMFVAPVAMLSAQSHSVDWTQEQACQVLVVPTTYVIQCHVAFLSHQRSDQY